jgi:hypothetical protein
MDRSFTCAAISTRADQLEIGAKGLILGIHYLRLSKKELKKHLRGVRPIERSIERNDAEAGVIRGYCLAVRSALTDDGRPPLEASGLKLHERISAIVASLTRVSEKGACHVS